MTPNLKRAALVGVALSMTVAGPAMAQEYPDNITQRAERAQTSQWVNCANEGDDCAPGTAAIVTTRYGAGASFTYFITQNVDKIPCKNNWGDPTKGTDKACAFITEDLLGVAGDETFSKVADEGKTFSHSAAGTFWVRYGTSDGWIYTLIEGGDAQTIECKNDYFGFDPVKGTNKVCQVGGAYQQGYGDMVQCATENQTCELSVGDVVLAKYGTEDRYDMRFVHHEGNAFPCDNNFFGYDPIHENKTCSYQAVRPVSAATLGKWTKVISCDGYNCPISHQIAVGTEKTNTWSTTSEWSVTVTASMEASFEIFGVGGKVNESVAESYATSLGFTDALSKSVTETYTASCDPSGDYFTRALWQFSTGTGESCLESGTCSGQTFTAEYICVGDAPATYAGPACVPGYCANALCTECSYD